MKEDNKKPLMPMSEAMRTYMRLMIARGMEKYLEYEKMVLEKLAKSNKNI